MKAFLVARSAIGWAAGLLVTIVFGLSGSLIAVIPGVKYLHHRMAATWGWLCVRATGCPICVDGLDAIDPDGQYVLMANHTSALDIPLLMSTIPPRWRTVFWAKTSLFRIPVLGRAMRALGHMPIDRTDRSTAGRMLAASIDRAKEGRSLLVFPEETYSPDGELLPFQRGGFVLALKMGLPILPVGVCGTRDALPPNSRLLKPKTLVLKFGTPISTVDLAISDRQRLMDETRGSISRLADKDEG